MHRTAFAERGGLFAVYGFKRTSLMSGHFVAVFGAEPRSFIIPTIHQLGAPGAQTVITVTKAHNLLYVDHFIP